jgi:MFS family permease
VYTLGSAVAAYLVGRYTQRLGRRIGLAAGFVAGGLGAAGVVVAAVTANVPLFFGALLVYGSGTATNLQARYAGTDLALPERRGSAISVAMVSTTLGAVAAPNLIDPLGSLAAVAYTLAGTMLFVLLRPDPLLLAKSWEPKKPAGGPAAAVLKPVGATYVLSLTTGYLVDKMGRIPLAIASGFTLLASPIIAAAALGESLGLIVLALMQLGLGWNFA